MNSKISDFISHREKMVLKTFKDLKGIFPTLWILSEDPQGKTEVTVQVLHPKLLDQDTSKDFIRHAVLEEQKKKLREKGHSILCVNWTSEGWMYRARIEDPNFLANYRDTPRTEVIYMSFSTKESTRIISYEIKRKMLVGPDGLEEEVDVEFVKLGDQTESATGRFSNMCD